jgi:hypothetical protein
MDAVGVDLRLLKGENGEGRMRGRDSGRINPSLYIQRERIT